MRGRPVAVGPVQDLFLLFAKLCCPGVNKTWLHKLCAMLGLVPEENTKWALLKVLVTHYLTIDRGAPPTIEEVLDILALEMAAGCGACNDLAMDTFMHVDDGALLMTREDKENFQASKDRYKRKLAERDEFNRHWKAAKRELAPPPAKGKGKGKGKAKAKAKAAAGPGDGGERRLPEGDIPQAMVAGLTPPAGHIWRGNKNGSWNGHLPPFARCSFAWGPYGHREALVMVLRDLWEKHLLMHGQSEADCPIQGLFDS